MKAQKLTAELENDNGITVKQLMDVLSKHNPNKKIYVRYEELGVWGGIFKDANLTQVGVTPKGKLVLW